MKILAIGRNYVEHAKELNNPIPDEPVIFLMPETALIQKNQPFFYPDFSSDIHYEVELVLKINKLGKNIEEKFAHRYYDEIGIGIDFTARDLQQQLKSKGLPWEKAKCFDGAAPLGKFVAKEQLPPVNNISFTLEKNGELVQQGNSGMMINSFDAIIAHVSKFFTLKIGDLIFTGTPAGVGPVKIGDNLVAKIEGKELLKVPIR
ncbi:MAG: 2-hydroxyhepta-2,4-diene-1,7-dioate isomerase [Bacteroidetes bacterium HGW-Bacteroidetes-4]|jgi:2-keto-4-pentenoate hydratase/2-oxohepta-3-ene-1,7-dioic acid hydratase in catechol pathway|nr:MAG: 2-hydroxyhepta-2,4-diene-1,7-dioate isomerase [Bacteroidetes bacterium HGW-Bacteroidetes-4]